MTSVDTTDFAVEVSRGKQWFSHKYENERVEVDDGYIGEAPKHVKTPNMFTQQKEQLAMQQRVRNRHETVNMRFKQWGCLRQKFRHGVD